MEFLNEYGLFLAKTLTVVAALVVIISAVASAGGRQKRAHEGHIEVTNLNERFEHWEEQLNESLLDKRALKLLRKQHKDKKKKRGGKQAEKDERKRLFVLEFDGDIRASAVENLRHEVSAVLTVARSSDEVLVKLESGGGLVHSYGLAASQLQRIVESGIPLTASIDRVAASGGYMMACIAQKILAAPFAVVGSIGVLAQLPNFHRLLKKHDIDFEMHTAGDYKRTLTLFGENTDEGREKFLEDLEETHKLFKEFVSENRPAVNIAEVATGEMWYGRRAVDKQLVDAIQTSDDYLLKQSREADIYAVRHVSRKSLPEKLGIATEAAVDRVAGRWLTRLTNRPLG